MLRNISEMLTPSEIQILYNEEFDPGLRMNAMAGLIHAKVEGQHW